MVSTIRLMLCFDRRYPSRWPLLEEYFQPDEYFRKLELSFTSTLSGRSVQAVIQVTN
jgi:hypothetical protein